MVSFAPLHRLRHCVVLLLRHALHALCGQLADARSLIVAALRPSGHPVLCRSHRSRGSVNVERHFVEDALGRHLLEPLVRLQLLLLLLLLRPQLRLLSVVNDIRAVGTDLIEGGADVDVAKGLNHRTARRLLLREKRVLGT